MKPPTTTRPTTRGLSRLLFSNTIPPHGCSAALPSLAGSYRHQKTATAAIHTSAPDPANVAPFYATGPPPEPPQPSAEHPYAKIERRRKQAELLRAAKEIRTASDGKGKSPLRKRFWQHVYVKEIDGAHSIPFHLGAFPSFLRPFQPDKHLYQEVTRPS